MCAQKADQIQIFLGYTIVICAHKMKIHGHKWLIWGNIFQCMVSEIL